jgi:protein-S-isoprenylcysteine O-methyltransferase Ste14
VRTLFETGRNLFRYRALIAGVAYVFLVIAANARHSVVGHAAMVLGLMIRIWAAGYIGGDARQREFQAEYIIGNGPYRYLKHPLYVGNFFLVLGVLILYNPPRWMGVMYLGVFLAVYVIILLSEADYLKGKPARETCYRLSNLGGELSTWLVLIFIYVGFFVLLKL